MVHMKVKMSDIEFEECVVERQKIPMMPYKDIDKTHVYFLLSLS